MLVRGGKYFSYTFYTYIFKNYRNTYWRVYYKARVQEFNMIRLCIINIEKVKFNMNFFILFVQYVLWKKLTFTASIPVTAEIVPVPMQSSLQSHDHEANVILASSASSGRIGNFLHVEKEFLDLFPM